jgi:iron complex transport system substrate-binding protein
MGGDRVRICSLLPSATEILYSLDLGDQVVAVTHECDYPPEAQSKPRITENVIDHERLTSAEIDHHVTANIGRHGSIYTLKQDLLESLKPDLIVTQELCEVCAVSYKDVKHEMFDTILLVGEMTNRKQAAGAKVSELRARLDRVRERVHGLKRPRVYAMEWLDPPFSGGHWVPEMVEIAGGDEVLGKPGAKSKRITVQQVIDADPEIVVLMPCGFSLERTVEEYRRTPFLQEWKGPAVYAVDGSSYFNRSGPRLVDGVEILADIFHPTHDRGADESSRNFKRLS